MGWVMNQHKALLVLFIWFVLAGRDVFADALSMVYNAALEGDMVKAFSALDAIDPRQLGREDTIAADCMRRTFTAPPEVEPLPPLSQSILTAYRHYWQTVMLRQLPKVDAERELLSELNRILAGKVEGVASSAGLDAASQRAREAIEKEGLFALTGVTSPYYELMIWKTQCKKRYCVKLPERAITVNVVFLDGFVSLGWASFATCGRYHSGGWSTQDTLFALKSAYDTESEEFRVSYLAHEARHFSDYKEYPKLEQPELEYRAKLTEIAVSKTSTHDLITDFAERTGLDRTVPHHYANYWVAKDLSREVFNSNDIIHDAEKWRKVSAGLLRRRARKLLRENDSFLRRSAAMSIDRFLGQGKR